MESPPTFNYGWDIIVNHQIYKQLCKLYKQLHDAFGASTWNGNLANVMKELLSIKDKADS
jgi:hypothetical protein